MAMALMLSGLTAAPTHASATSPAQNNPAILADLAPASVEPLAQEPTTQEPVSTPPEEVPEDSELEEVVVSAVKMPINVTSEKLSYDVTADPDAQSLSLLDLLKKLPGVTVDGLDKITVNGSGNFSVEIDGRPNPAFSREPEKIFKSIPASMVERVEVVTTPGARYDAEGVGGVINIVMRGKNEKVDGESLTISAIGGNINQNGSLFGMIKRGLFGLTINLNGGHSRQNEMFIDMLREQTNGFTSDYDGAMRNEVNYGRAQIDATFDLSKADRLMLSGLWNMFDWSNRFSAQTALSMNGINTSNYGMLTDMKGRMNNITAGAEYYHIFAGDSRNKLKFGYQFDSQPAKNSSNISYSAEEGTLPADSYSLNRTNMPQHQILAEYTLPFGNIHTLEAGAKMTFRKSSSESVDLDYLHRTTIAAGFASYGIKLDKFDAKAGLRYEHTHQNAHFIYGAGEDFKANYSNFVPSASIGFRPSISHSFSASYSMRISRPGISQLNPYEDKNNPLQIMKGNPRLSPEEHSTISLSYNGFSSNVVMNARVNYSFCNNGLTTINSLNNGLLYISYANTLRSRMVSIPLFANWRIGGKTSLMASVTPTYSLLRADGYSNHGWQLQVFAGLEQKLPGKLNLGANIYAMTPQVELQGRGMSQLIHTLSLSRAFMKDDRLNVSLTCVNPFYGRFNIYQRQDGRDFRYFTKGHMNLRIVQVSVSLRLGSLHTDVERRTGIDSDTNDTTNAPATSPSIGM